MRLEHIDPRTLLIDANIRSAAELDPDFVESVREFGVMQALTAVEAPDGIRVRMDKRRTLAAIETGRLTVPVVVISADNDDEADRIIRQWHENELRRGLNVSVTIIIRLADRRGRPLMPEQLLHVPQAHPALVVVRGAGVARQVRRQVADRAGQVRDAAPS